MKDTMINNKTNWMLKLLLIERRIIKSFIIKQPITVEKVLAFTRIPKDNREKQLKKVTGKLIRKPNVTMRMIDEY